MNEAVDIFSLEMIKNLFEQNKAQGLENEEFRHNLDRYLRKKAISFGDTSVSLETIEKFLKFVVSLAKEELCYKALTVNVMQDVFDVSDIKRCEQLFSIIEDNISIWKAPFFFEACKNQILRMSNDLLKRLSRTVDTNFCGRILILLAKSLPLTEKSGLNLISQFNTANTTIYEEEKKEEKPEDEAIGEEHDMEVGEIRENHQDKDSTIPVDYTHYLKFWQLQEYFSSPLLCYEKPLSWKKFEHNLSEILNIFSTYKLDRQNYKYDRDREKSVVSNVGTRHGSIDEAKNSLKQEDAVMKIHEMDWQAPIFETDKDDAFFAKYLTNQKLFQLQIADSQFRRYFLVQCLILTQYLTLDVKFRDTTCFLSEDQKKFVSEVTDKCYKLLKETYPHGSQFSESIKKILNREKLWSQWKNDGCPDVLKNIRGQKVQMFKKKPTQNYDPEKIDLGNQELTRLWNINPDIQSACKDTKRRFVPNVDRFVSDALDELDPEQQVDDEYKCINNEGWQWRASRLLLFETDQYITTCCAGTPAKALNAPTNTAKFLEEVLKNISINSTTKELKEKGEEIFKRIELKKQQDEEKAAALAADKKKEEAAALLAKKIEEEAKRASIEGPKEEPMETSHVEPTPVTPVPSSPKKLKLEPKQEVEERIEEQRKRKATVTSDETQPQKSVEKESSAEASSNSIAPKKLKVETKEHKESSSAPSKESASSKNPSQITDKEIQILSGLLHDYKKLAEVLEIPINISIPKHRKPESIVKSLLELWQRKDPSKATLSKLSMILATNDFLDERISSAIKELTKSREKDKDKHSSSRRREEK